MPNPLTLSPTYIDCKGKNGGAIEVMFIELQNISGITLTGQQITGITRVATKIFRKYTLERNAVAWSYPLTVNDNGSLTYAHTLSIDIRGLTLALDTEIKLLGLNHLAAIITDTNNMSRMAGITATDFEVSRGINLTGSGADGKKALSENPGYVLTFAGLEGDYMHEVDPTILAALLTP